MKGLSSILMGIALLGMAEAHADIKDQEYCAKKNNGRSYSYSYDYDYYYRHFNPCRAYKPNPAAAVELPNKRVMIPDDIKKQAYYFASASVALIDSKNASAEQLTSALTALSDLTVPPTAEQESIDIKFKTALRLNNSFYLRFQLIYIMSRLMDTYKDVHPEIVSSFTDELSIIAQLDWYSKARRLAMMSYVALENDKSKVNDLLRQVYQRDGQVVFDGSIDDGKVQAGFSGILNTEGEEVFTITMATDIDVDVYWNSIYLVKRKEFVGTRPELEKISQSLQSELVPKLVEEIKNLQKQRDEFVRSHPDNKFSNRVHDIDQTLRKLRAMESQARASNLKGLDVQTRIAKSRDLGNGVTRYMSRENKQLAAQIKGKMEMGEPLDFDTLLSYGYEKDLLDDVFAVQEVSQ